MPNSLADGDADTTARADARCDPYRCTAHEPPATARHSDAGRYAVADTHAKPVPGADADSGA